MDLGADQGRQLSGPTGRARESQGLVCLSLPAEEKPQSLRWRSGGGREQELELAEKYGATSHRGWHPHLRERHGSQRREPRGYATAAGAARGRHRARSQERSRRLPAPSGKAGAEAAGTAARGGWRAGRAEGLRAAPPPGHESCPASRAREGLGAPGCRGGTRPGVGLRARPHTVPAVPGDPCPAVRPGRGAVPGTLRG